jgi:hypothetical protein
MLTSIVPPGVLECVTAQNPPTRDGRPTRGARRLPGLLVGPSDEDITIIDTTIPVTTSPFVANQGPITRARARKLNYQVNSFLAIEANSSLNEVLKPCDDFIMLRCLGGEPSWTGEGNKAIKAAAPERIS